MPVPSPISSMTVTETIQLAYLGSVTHAASFKSPEGLILVLVQCLLPSPYIHYNIPGTSQYCGIYSIVMEKVPVPRKKEAQNQGFEGAFSGTIT